MRAASGGKACLKGPARSGGTRQEEDSSSRARGSAPAEQPVARRSDGTRRRQQKNAEKRGQDADSAETATGRPVAKSLEASGLDMPAP